MSDYTYVMLYNICKHKIEYKLELLPIDEQPGVAKRLEFLNFWL